MMRCLGSVVWGQSFKIEMIGLTAPGVGWEVGLARQLRFEYPGVVHHIMAHGDGGKCIFPGKEDHQSFPHWLEQGPAGAATHGKFPPPGGRLLRYPSGFSN